MSFVQDELADDGQAVLGVIIAHEDDQRIRRALRSVITGQAWLLPGCFRQTDALSAREPRGPGGFRLVGFPGGLFEDLILTVLAGSMIFTADLIRRQLLPQAEALVRSGAASYAVDRTDLASVLRNEHDLSDIRLQLLAAEFDSQRQLAVIERLIGGDL